MKYINADNLIDEKPAPLDIAECPECGSIFTYEKVEAYYNQIHCSVCGIWHYRKFASFQKFKDGKEESECQNT